MKEKIRFKNYSKEYKKIISICYSFTALMATLTGYAIKNNKEIGPAIFGSSIALSATAFAHVHAKDEMRKRVRDSKEYS